MITTDISCTSTLVAYTSAQSSPQYSLNQFFFFVLILFFLQRHQQTPPIMAGWLGGLPPLALATFAYHHLFLVLAQLENYVTDHSLLGKGVGSFARLIVNILFWQLEPLLFSVSLGALAVVVGAHQSTYRHAWIRILFFCGVVGSTAYVVVDQVRAWMMGLVCMGCLQSPPYHCCARSA